MCLCTYVPHLKFLTLILYLPAFLLFCSCFIATCTSPLVNAVFIGAADTSGSSDRWSLNKCRNIFGNAKQLD